MRKCNIRGHQCEPYYQWHNRAEESIQKLKWRMIKCDPLNVSGILVWYTNPRFCLEYHGDITVEHAWVGSQETRRTLANGRNLSSMNYVGIGIHPMNGKTRSSEYGLVFPTA